MLVCFDTLLFFLMGFSYENKNDMNFVVSVLVDDLSQPRGFSFFGSGQKQRLVIADNQSSEIIEVRNPLSQNQRSSILARPLFGINSVLMTPPQKAEDLRLYSTSTIDSGLRRLTFTDLIFKNGVNP